jgi:hypothetical protein
MLKAWCFKTNIFSSDLLRTSSAIRAAPILSVCYGVESARSPRGSQDKR